MKNFTSADIKDYPIGDSLPIPGKLDASWPHDFIYAPLWFHKRGLQQTSNGYGAKLTNAFKISLNSKLYRVYTTIYSNNGSCWIISKGRKIYVD